jgi:hypothetical protein
MLIVAAIAATSVIVRLWPVDAGAPPLASRPIHLYQGPATPPAVPPPTPTVSVAARTRPQPRLAVVAAAPSAPVPPVVEAQTTPAAPEIAAAETPPAGAPAVDVPIPMEVPVVVADVSAADGSAAAVVTEAVVPVPSSSRGLVEVPAVAVTRAVTVAGRGIISGLRATGAIVRAAF